MADEITIKANLDISNIKKGLAEVQNLQGKMLATGKQAVVPRLSKDIDRSLASGGGFAQSKDLQKSVNQQARLVALKLQEYEVQKRIKTQSDWSWDTGKRTKADNAFREKLIKSAGNSYSAASGQPIDFLSFEKSINKTLKNFSSTLKGLDLDVLGKGFLDLARSETSGMVGVKRTGRLISSHSAGEEMVSSASAEITKLTSDIAGYKAALKELAKQAKVAAAALEAQAKQIKAQEKKEKALDEKSKRAERSLTNKEINTQPRKGGGSVPEDPDLDKQAKSREQALNAKEIQAEKVEAERARKEREREQKAEAANRKKQRVADEKERNREAREREKAQKAEAADRKRQRVADERERNKEAREREKAQKAEAANLKKQKIADEKEQKKVEKQKAKDAQDKQNQDIFDEFGTAGSGALKRFIQAVLNAGDQITLGSSEFVASMARLMAEEEALIAKMRGLSARALLDDDELMGDTVTGTASKRVKDEKVRGDVSQAIANNPDDLSIVAGAQADRDIGEKRIKNVKDRKLIQRDEFKALSAEEQINVLLQRINSLDAQTNSKRIRQLQAQVQLRQQALKLDVADIIEADPKLRGQRTNNRTREARNREREAIRVNQELLDDEDYVRDLAESRRLRQQLANIGKPGKPQPLSIGGRFREMMGKPGEFFGTGMLTTMKYALPSAAMWGSVSAISDGVQDAEEFNLVLSQLKIQFEDTGRAGTGAFEEARASIVALSKESGVMAAEIAEITRHLEGAFGQMTKVDLSDPTGSKGGLMGGDGIIRYGEALIEDQKRAAVQLSLVTGITTSELTDGLTAASLAFGASASRIGDVAVKLESVGGTKAKDLISFIGDIGPSAREAGFELEELMAIANSALKRSGMNGAAIAEQLGRIMAAMSGNSTQFFDIADANRSTLGEKVYQDFVGNIASGDTRSVFMTLAKYYKDLDKTSRDTIVNMIGGQRQANTLLAAFGDAEGLDDMIEAAGDSYGALERRYASMQEKLTVVLSRLKAEFNEIVRLVLDAGLGDAISGIAQSFALVLNIVTKLAKPIVIVNDALGGVGSTLAGLILQLAALKLAMVGLAAARGSNLGTRLFGEVTPSLQPKAGAVFKNKLMQQTFANAGGGAVGASALIGSAGMSMPKLMKGVGAMGSLKALGSASVAALGPVGMGFLVLTGVSMAVGKIQDGIEKDRAKVSELRASLMGDDRSIKELEEAASKASDFSSAFSKAWHEFFNISSDRAIYEMEIARRKAQPAIDRLQAAVDSYEYEEDEKDPFDTIIRSGVGQVDPSRYDKPAPLDLLDIVSNVFMSSPSGAQGAGVASDLAKNDAMAILRNIGLMDENGAGIGGFTVDDINEVLKNKEIMKGLLYSTNTSEILTALDVVANANPDNAELNNTITLIKGAIATTTSSDSTTAGLIADANAAMSDFANASGDALGGAFESIQLMFQNGQISSRDYIASVQTKIANLNQRKQSVPLTEAEKKMLIEMPSKLSADMKAWVDGQLQVSELLYQISGQNDLSTQVDRVRNGLGLISPDQALEKAILSISDNTGTQSKLGAMGGSLNILNNEGITDPTVRFGAAADWITNAQEMLNSSILNAESAVEATRLAEEGIAIPTEIKGALLEATIRKSDEFIEYYNSWTSFMNAVIAQTKSITNGELALEDAKFAQVAQEVGFDPNVSVSEYVNELMRSASTGTMSDATKEELKTKIASLLGLDLDSKGFTAEEQQKVMDMVAALGNILILAGESSDTINGIVSRAKPKTNPFSWTAIKNKVQARVPTFTDKSFGTDMQQLENLRPDPNTNRERGRVDLDLRLANIDYLRAFSDGDAATEARLDKAAAEAERQYAMANLTGAERTIAIKKADTAIVKANRSAAKAAQQINVARFSLMAALADDRGDIVGVAQAGLSEAQYMLSMAKTQEERISAQASVVRAQKAVREAKIQEREAQVGLLRTTTTGEDPVKQAEFDKKQADLLFSEARGIAARAEAAKRQIEAQREVQSAIFDVQMSVFELREAQLNALDDEVGAAYLNAQVARVKLADAVSRDAGQAEINRLKAEIINADKSARDAVFNEKLEDYQYLLDTGKITKSQYVEYLEGLKSTLDPASKQFKDLERTLYQLKNDIGSDLQMNLPTNLSLPTLYEARRLDQSTSSNGIGTSSIGYQDNRNMDVQIVISQNMDEGKIVSILADALGVGRNALTTTKRY